MKHKSVFEQRQEEALAAYDRVPQSEAAGFLQAAMLAEIALQLAGVNEKLNTITERGGSLDLQAQILHEIEKALKYGKVME